ncbi:hypothetical protein ADK90_03090 [Streptomyces sp. XY413]|nr:hypothetical protein ADK90_03090 [Streptomyces sp. XY413]
MVLRISTHSAGAVRAVVTSGAVGLDPADLHLRLLVAAITVVRGRRQRGGRDDGARGQALTASRMLEMTGSLPLYDVRDDDAPTV